VQLAAYLRTAASEPTPDSHVVQSAAYLRISLDLTGQMLGIDRQRSATCQLCATRGWPPPVEYVDNSVGAWSPRGPGTAYARLLADARAGRIDAVIVWDLDRLTRSPSEVEDWIKICEKTGLRIVTVDGEIDTATENGRLFLRIKGAVARHELEHKAARQKAAHAQRAEKGLPPSGPRALGWGPDGTIIIPAEADAIRDACTAILAGASLRAIARAWNTAGLTTTPKRPRGTPPDAEKIGQPWRPYSVRGVLLNPRIAGLRARQTSRDQWEIIAAGTWPALVPEGMWRAVSARLRDATRRTTDSTVRRYLLSGLAVCGVPGCGQLVVSGGRARPRARTYRCSASNHLCRAAEPVDMWVVELVLRRLSRPDAASLLVDAARPDAGVLRERAVTLRADLDGLARLLLERVLTEAGVRAESMRIRAELAEVEAMMVDAGRAGLLGPLIGAADVRAAWLALDVDAQRAVVTDLMAGLALMPPGRGARTFDPGTVVHEWRAP
jgi:site-specific DNA recombinase